MWIPKWVVEQWRSERVDRRTLADLMGDLHALRATNLELEKRCLTSEVHADWLRARLNHVETERAVLLSRQTGLPFGAPVIRPAEGETGEAGIPSIMDDLSFEDIGDAKARQLGIDDE